MSVFTDFTRMNNANLNYLKVLANKDRFFDLINILKQETFVTN